MRLARRLLLAVWAGLLISFGGVVAPTLFAMLADRHVAGLVAGSLFRTAAVISAAVGALLIILAAGGKESGARAREARAAGPAIVLSVSECLVHPMVEAARAAGGVTGLAFGAWHAVASGLYWVATVWVAVELIQELRR